MLCNIESCTGCGACVNICPKDCIKLQYDKHGFLQPYINVSECVSCGKCDAVCPVLNTIEQCNYTAPICYAGWNKDAKVRHDSSSGGVFSALAEYLFSLGGIVCGVVLDDELHPYHTVASTKDDVKRMMGSKYLQSDTKLIFRQVKKALFLNRYVLFSGCSCQIAGLYTFLGNKKFEKLITCEIVCHGVSSISLFNWYKAYLEKKTGSSIVDVDFRSKKYGWSVSAMDFFYANGKKETIKARSNLFMKAFYASLSIRKSCVECNYAKLPRVADFTIGDYWRAVVQNYSKKERQQGISLILINNEKAANVISAIKDKMFLEPITLQDATAENTRIVNLDKVNPKRDEFLSEYKHSDVRYLMTKYFPITLKSYISALLGKKLTYRLKAVIKKITRR